MKKAFPVLAAVTTAITLTANDLHIDGKFKHISDGLPVRWVISAPKNAKFVRGEELFSHPALQLTAGKTAVTATTAAAYPVNNFDTVKVEAEIKGSGKAYLAVQLLDAKDKIIATPRVAIGDANGRFRDLKGALRITQFAQHSPAKVKIIFGVEPGSTVAFDEIEAELDND